MDITYLKNRFTKTLRQKSIGCASTINKLIELTKFKMLPQLTDLWKHRNRHFQVNFTDTELQLVC